MGNWSGPYQAPFPVGTMLLLTDGRILAAQNFTETASSRSWWLLTPDESGRYNHSNWIKTGDAANPRLYFASAVLRDGKVFVAGGEYGIDPKNATDQATAELYDPTTGTWNTLPTPGWTKIGDAPCCVLPDGQVLLGSIDTGSCALFDPETSAWTPTGAKLNGSSSEETWTLLPDESVLTADCIGQPESERYINRIWRAEGNTDPGLVDSIPEIGPAILLPDGRVVAIGATGNVSVFQPNLNSGICGKWTPGNQLPQSGAKRFAARDAPACLLPNGKILLAASAVDLANKEDYGTETTFFEYDDNDISDVGNTGTPAFACRMLLLPTGEVLVSDGTEALRLYQSDGTPNDNWRPTISTLPDTLIAGVPAVVGGSLFNGLSQACSYGDDAAMATNYPLARLTSATDASKVYFCLTSNHSSMGVARWNQNDTTEITVPV